MRTNRKQAERLAAFEPEVRRILVCVTNGDITQAHAIVDDLARSSTRQVRFCDIHLKDCGIHQFIVADLDKVGIYTISDLFNVSPEKLAIHLDVLDLVRAMAKALQTICHLQDLSACA